MCIRDSKNIDSQITLEKQKRVKLIKEQDVPIASKSEVKTIKKAQVPRLNLSKLNQQLENSELDIDTNSKIEAKDYNDEFMSMADFFSQSWKDALAKEKRY
eukprot:TRINITY_DN9972_c0_g2_i2.p1 TRINITY_DN9972_c0_g2~~TRINITY_DN9972_c0_g2_i2.p1  ORF type:complete len:101 (+),score=32.73 TRINITY_DN9972_c0_g2_i2:74-376(+)